MLVELLAGTSALLATALAYSHLRNRRLVSQVTFQAQRFSHDVKYMESMLASKIQRETGFTNLEEFLGGWKRHCYGLGYALHHIYDFQPSYLLTRQLALAGSHLRSLSQGGGHAQMMVFHLQRAAELGVFGGYREAGLGFVPEEYGGKQYAILSAEMNLLLDGMAAETVAEVCCSILDGFHLEGALLRAGICVYSPTGKAMAAGQLPLNQDGYCLPPARKVDMQQA